MLMPKVVITRHACFFVAECHGVVKLLAFFQVTLDIDFIFRTFV